MLVHTNSQLSAGRPMNELYELKASPNLWERWTNLIYKLLARQVDATGLAVFRILFCISLLGEVLTLYFYRHVVYDAVAYVRMPEISMEYPLYIWMGSLLLLIIGYKTKVAAMVNYLLTVIMIGTTTDFEYHINYTYLAVGFLFMFLDVNQVLSVDSWLARRNKESRAKTISYLQYYLPLLFGIGTIYLNSSFHKLSSDVWLEGLGVWLPSSVPMMAKVNLQPLLDQKLIMQVVSWLVVAFEISFCFLMWNQKTRWVLFLVGFPFHVGIFFMYPIPWFATTYLVTLLLLLPPDLWSGRLKTKNNVPVILPVHIGVVKKYSILVAVFAILELNADFQSGIWKKWKDQLGVSKLPAVQWWHKQAAGIMGVTSHTLGMALHNVFMDQHFTGYNHNIGIVHVEKNGEKVFIPVTEESGLPGAYMIGFNWAKWGFRSNGTLVVREDLADGISRFSAHYLMRRKIFLDSVSHFEVIGRIFDSPKEWQKGYLTTMNSRSWHAIGTVDWKDRKVKVSIPDIEKEDINKYPLFVK